MTWCPLIINPMKKKKKKHFRVHGSWGAFLLLMCVFRAEGSVCAIKRKETVVKTERETATDSMSNDASSYNGATAASPDTCDSEAHAAPSPS